MADSQDPVGDLRSAYASVFHNPVGERVANDLRRFCRAEVSTFHTDPHVSAYQQGRRDVWLHINEILEMPEEELRALYTSRKAK